MQIFPTDFEEKLGIDQIKQQLADYCGHPENKLRFLDLTALNTFVEMRKTLEETFEYKVLLESGDFRSITLDFSPARYLAKVRIKGAFLDESQFQELLKCLSLFFDLRSAVLLQSEDAPHLFAKASKVQLRKDFFRSISSKFNDNFELRDDASPELARIRRKIRSTNKSLTTQLNKKISFAQDKGYSEAGSNFTIRNGRLVIPVLSSYKRQISGLVHDESATGRTVFLEPAEAVESNNQLKELGFAEKREIEKILISLSESLEPILPEIFDALDFLKELEFVQAKAKWARKYNATLPKLHRGHDMNWIEARHPLLSSHLKALGKDLVPLNVSLGAEHRILVISGPNAGGKSITLKTVGLLQYLLQLGILVPAHEKSTFGFFEKIFVDMGDEQSLENDLSTYSSHLNNMRIVLDEADNNSLLLFDEFGSGTEPHLGAAIASSILKAINAKGCWGVLTTHYGNLKDLAAKEAGLENAAMRFDSKKIKPLFSLEIGRPGSSFAFEIAKKMGIPDKILEAAREDVGRDPVILEEMLEKLSSQKHFLETEKRNFRRNNKRLTAEARQYEKLQAELQGKKKEIIEAAKGEAFEILRQSNQKIEQTIAEIKSSGASKEVTKEVRQELEKHKESVRPKKRKKKVSHAQVKTLDGPVKVGDSVLLDESTNIWNVFEVKPKEAGISAGGIKSYVSLKRLRRVEGKKEKPTASKSRNVRMFDQIKMKSEFKSQLDVRGKRVNEVFELVDVFIDNAIITGAEELRILHGKGSGVLRDTIRQHLRSHPQVSHAKDEEVTAGGSGITVLSLKA